MDCDEGLKTPIRGPIPDTAKAIQRARPIQLGKSSGRKPGVFIVSYSGANGERLALVVHGNLERAQGNGDPGEVEFDFAGGVERPLEAAALPSATSISSSSSSLFSSRRLNPIVASEHPEKHRNRHV